MMLMMFLAVQSRQLAADVHDALPGGLGCTGPADDAHDAFWQYGLLMLMMLAARWPGLHGAARQMMLMMLSGSAGC